VLQRNVDTIAAIATAQGRGGIGVIRVSGSDIEPIAQGLLGKFPTTRYAEYCNFLDNNGDTLDQGIALYFQAPNSFTGENVLEFQGHGGPAVLQLLLNRCLDLGARLAQPGEFTKRAFLNDKLDLAQAESVADLIEANTAEAARSAMRSLRGDFSNSIHDLVEGLIRLRMLVEAMLDFPEEEVDAIDMKQRDKWLKDLRDRLQVVSGAAKQGSLLREGAHIVIAGQPNVGKSSLLNQMSGDDVALVSDVPGTTRDVVRQTIQIYGVPLHIMDTAGLRKSDDIVEKMGIERTYQTLHKADLILLMLDASKGVTAEDKEIVAGLPNNIPRIVLLNKVDLLQSNFTESSELTPDVSVSAKTGEGIEALRAKLMAAVGWRDQEAGAFMARERHLRALSVAQSHLERSAEVLASAELFAEELRLAQHALSEITGEFTSDDLLGEIFTRFCIGK